MSANAALPTIVLVHGAWHTPPAYQTFSDALTSAGFSVHCPRLPSCSGTSPPTASFAEDVEAVRAVVSDRVAAGERVFMVMHSYGGLVGTEAVTDDLLYKAGGSGGGGVVHLLYLCAYMLQAGTSVIDIAKAAGFFPLWEQFVRNDDDGLCFPIDAAAMFFGEGAEAKHVEAALPHLVRFPLSTFSAQAGSVECWKKVPVTYVNTSRDGAMPGVYQDIVLERAAKDGIVVRKEVYDTCHSVFVTKQKEMVELALEVAKDERNAE
ncbi:Alpha/beta hydrolase fold-1 [Massariosphaeria phaeospora]|uniref:Alpha/beta hydrolase fold-1 n=1 Tax=Massariosphaeria phaeospora TaxID=100035 RepID=A0A7C8IAV5_9PLEO|nr:Alpha/beta hydrolase fold-1 [Massariosphaeria phaeospora]